MNPLTSEFEQLRYMMMMFDEEIVHKPRKKQIIQEERKNTIDERNRF